MKLAVTIGLISIALIVALIAGHALNHEGLQAPVAFGTPASVF